MRGRMTKGKPTDGIVSRYLNRRVSRLISNYMISKGITPSPNTLTILLFLFSLTALPLYLAGLAWAGGIVVQASSILDGVDGEIARATGRASKKGAFLDSMLDRFANMAFLMGASFYALTHSSYSPQTVLVVSMLCLSGDMLVSYIHSKATETLGVHPALVGVIPSIASRDVRLFILFAASLANRVVEGMVIIACLSLFYVTAKIVECYRKAGR